MTVTPGTTPQVPTAPTTPISTPPPTTPPPTTAAPKTEQSTTSIVTSVVSTVVEFQTIISSIEISSGVFSTTGLVVSSTRVFTTLAAVDPTNTSPPSPSATSASTAPSAAVIAGASIAGTVVLAALGFLIFYCARRGRTRRRPDSLDFPPTMREPTIPVLLHNPDDRYRDVPVSPVELSPTTSPTPRYSAMYGPPPQGVVELQEQHTYPGAGGKCEFLVLVLA